MSWNTKTQCSCVNLSINHDVLSIYKCHCSMFRVYLETAVMVRLVEVILISVDRKDMNMFYDRRELSEDGYGLGNLRLWVCLFYFRKKHWCHMKEQGVCSVRCGRMKKRREKEAVLGLKGDIGWGRLKLTVGKGQPCCSLAWQKVSVTSPWMCDTAVWLLQTHCWHICATAVPQPTLLPPWRPRVGRRVIVTLGRRK